MTGTSEEFRHQRYYDMVKDLETKVSDLTAERDALRDQLQGVRIVAIALAVALSFAVTFIVTSLL